MVLSNTDILLHLHHTGKVVIDPFEPKNLSTSSYDVSLGEWYFEETKGYDRQIYNPWSEKETRRVWGEAKKAIPLRKAKPLNYESIEGVNPDDLVILISPGATILAHTLEFIGGRGNITTKMQARSSMGRNFIEVCKCAGWGDVGFINRWTMEITNNSRYHSIPLVVGRRVAQIVFLETNPNVESSYEKEGKYQMGKTLAELKAKWSPEMMLPKLYLDREIHPVE